MLKTVWNWLVWSSENPDKVSLTLKAGIPALVFGFGFVGYQVQDQLFDGLVNQIVSLLAGIATVVTSLMAIFGIIRKITKNP